ncbi:MAG TPA: hypothetical protein VJB96_03175 [Patescibacteria group bacterium]|nr:hypothetical protein [Patescibacteria group bacterium]
MHRNTLLVVAFLAVIAALLVGINVGRSLTQSNPAQPTPVSVSNPTPTLGYMSGTSCGVTFTYPNSLQTMESSASGVVLVSTSNPNDSIVLVCQEDIPRVPLPPENIESLTITSAVGATSVSAKLYHDASPKDGLLVDKLIFTHPKTKLDVFVAGFGPVFQQFLTSLQLQ